MIDDPVSDWIDARGVAAMGTGGEKFEERSYAESA